MYVVISFISWLILLYRKSVGLRESVLTNARHLPAHLHTRCLDAGVEKVLIGGIKRMINFEGKRTFRESTGNINISNELPGCAAKAKHTNIVTDASDTGTSFTKGKAKYAIGAVALTNHANPAVALTNHTCICVTHTLHTDRS